MLIASFALCLFCMLALSLLIFFFFFFNDTATTEIYTLSLHDALPISTSWPQESSIRDCITWRRMGSVWAAGRPRSEEHTSELQSRLHLVCRLLLEKKKKHKQPVDGRDVDISKIVKDAQGLVTYVSRFH